MQVIVERAEEVALATSIHVAHALDPENTSLRVSWPGLYVREEMGSWSQVGRLLMGQGG